MNWKRLPSVLVLVLGLLAGMALSPVLSGCAAGRENFNTVIQSIVGLPEESRIELDRFQDVYEDLAVRDGDFQDQFRHFKDAYARIRSEYVKPVPDRDLITFAIEAIEDPDAAWREDEALTDDGRLPAAKVVDVALDGMLAALDPHSGYMTPQEFNEMMVDTRGEFGGLGIEVSGGDGFIRVVAPIEDTPAYRAGVKAGDRIVGIDGTSIRDWNLSQAVREMRGKPGTDITITVERDDLDSTLDITITRAVITVRPVRWSIEDGYGHLRIVKFSERLETSVTNALSDMFREADGTLKGLVLDLRNNPGGLLDQSVALADAFLESGEVVSVRGRSADNQRSYEASAGDLARGLPMVVLINGGSASASEIVAGSLQDYDRAIVMGRKSFGKGSVQVIMPLRMEGALRLTNALYYLPSGRTIQSRGVNPDIILDRPVDPDAGTSGDTSSSGPQGSHFQGERDLPNVLDVQMPENAVDTHAKSKGRLSADVCPATGEREDRELGCAIWFLKSGSVTSFLTETSGG